MLTLAVVCEADADRRIACDLADRVFVEQIGWLSLEDLPHQRLWRGRTIQEPFLSWARASELAREMKFRAHGHFHGVPGAPDAVATRKALVVLRMSDPLPDGIVLTRDDDGDVSRLKGIRQAVGEYVARNATPVAVGVAHVMRENWVIAGFLATGDAERNRLEQLVDTEKFEGDPTMQPYILTANVETAKRSPKRVVRILTDGDRDREAQCWQETPLAVLRVRGRLIGLTAYLDDIGTTLVPLFQ